MSTTENKRKRGRPAGSVKPGGQFVRVSVRVKAGQEDQIKRYALLIRSERNK